MIVIGIDPGKSGGIAMLDGRAGASAERMPASLSDLLGALGAHIFPGTVVAYVEQVHALPTDGRSSAFKFGRNYGACEMAVVAAGHRLERVTPAKWQKFFGLARGDKSKAEHKRIIKAKAQELFPGVKVTLATADALMIAEYGYRIECSRRGGSK